MNGTIFQESKNEQQEEKISQYWTIPLEVTLQKMWSDQDGTNQSTETRRAFYKHLVENDDPIGGNLLFYEGESGMLAEMNPDPNGNPVIPVFTSLPSALAYKLQDHGGPIPTLHRVNPGSPWFLEYELLFNSRGYDNKNKDDSHPYGFHFLTKAEADKLKDVCLSEPHLRDGILGDLTWSELYPLALDEALMTLLNSDSDGEVLKSQYEFYRHLKGGGKLFYLGRDNGMEVVHVSNRIAAFTTFERARAFIAELGIDMHAEKVDIMYMDAAYFLEECMPPEAPAHLNPPPPDGYKLMTAGEIEAFKKLTIAEIEQTLNATVKEVSDGVVLISSKEAPPEKK